MNLDNVMTQVAQAAGTITGVRAFAYPPDKVHPPAFMTTLPSEINPHATYARGMSTIRMTCLFLVDRVQDRSSVKKLVSYLGMSGPLSLVRALEGFAYTACDSVVVSDIAADKVITIGQMDHLGAEFTLDIAGSGTT